MEALTDEILKAIRPTVLKLVTNAFEGKDVSVTSSETKSDTQYEVKRKQTVDFTKNPVCVMVTSYTPKSNALFGDFKKRYESFKDEVMKVKKDTFKPNNKLQFGFGWTFEKSKTADVEKLLKKHKVEFRKVTLEDYESEVFGDSPKKKESGDNSEEEVEKPPRKLPSKAKKNESEEEKPKKKAKKETKKSDDDDDDPEETEKPKKKTKGELELKKNAWGNMEEEESLIVFHKLPVGPKGKDIYVAIGFQDQDEPKSKKGISSLLPLTSDLEELCVEKEWKHLTEDMVPKIEDKDLKKQIKLLREKIPQEEESEAEVEEDSEEEENDDEDDE